MAIDRKALLHGPIPGTLFGLAWPVLTVLALQTSVGVAETWFVSFLGTDAVAGVTLVFPVFMLMTMMSNGGIGGGVSSAVARAVGAGRMEDARALATHAVVVGAAFGAAFSLAVWAGGRALFEMMGGRGEALDSATLYAGVVFAAAVPGWIANLLASAMRGAGDVRTPALVTAAGTVATLALSPLFIFGWGFVPGLGVAGAGVALIVFNVGSAVALALYMRSRRSPLPLRRARLEWRLFSEILRVGLLSAIGTVVTNLTVVLTTGLVGGFGSDAIAGFGLASRLDYILIPPLFALGTATITLAGANVGAGQHARALRVAWVSAAISAASVEAIGVVAALFPEGWMRLFSHDAAVIASGAAYLARVAPAYAFFGAGMALYFASQGAGRMTWPFAAGLARLVFVWLAGSWWIGAGGSADGLFWIVAAGYVLLGATNIVAMSAGVSWGSSDRPVRFTTSAAARGR